jgi:hypothetical protein
MAMHGEALATDAAVVTRLPLKNFRRRLDIGGGPGSYSVMLSGAYPELHATVLDLPPVIRIASGLIDQQGAVCPRFHLARRLSHQAVPRGQ